MLGLLIGAVCGSIELLLLNRTVKSVTEGKLLQTALYFLLKLFVLACAFVPVILFLRSELLWCGVGVTGALIVGSITMFAVQTHSKGGKKA